MIQIVVCRLPVSQLPPARQEEVLFTVWPGVAAESVSAPYNYVCLSPDRHPCTLSHVRPLFQLVVGRQYPTLTRPGICSCRKCMCGGGSRERVGSMGGGLFWGGCDRGCLCEGKGWRSRATGAQSISEKAGSAGPQGPAGGSPCTPTPAGGPWRVAGWGGGGSDTSGCAEPGC